ncbi:hypothetical protein Ahy_B01g052799 isoform A [Arachis hypogaea]|uniref:BAHD acyltransferase n=1 Tax=Arachis hypogaea TaxID=3818 RepID=A0A445AQK6_ARAHY|nr:hypothetical protein Ahy_B01g052799 isoform A [Arachis hypogaea]
MKEENQNWQNSTPETPVRVFHYTKEKIAQLKAKANAEAKTENISSLQALLTHFWISVIRCSCGAVGAKALATGSSPRFNVYGNDFGWGKPVAVRAGSNIGEGMVVLFGGKEEGSVDVQVCLPYEILEAMESDSEFIDAF